ncbi:MAG: PH domain-containing protein [Thermoplasmata archaeon]
MNENFQLYPYETLLGNVKMHRVGMLKLYISTIISVCLIILFVFASGAMLRDIRNDAEALFNLEILTVITLVVGFLIYFLSFSFLKKYLALRIFGYIWVIGLSFVVAICAVAALYEEFLRSFPEPWWSEILGSQFKLSSIFFVILLMILSSILYKIASLVGKDYRLPLVSASITMAIVSLITLLPSLEFIYSQQTRKYAFLLLTVLTIGYAAISAFYLAYGKEMEAIITNQRVIIAERFLSTRYTEKPYDQILKVIYSQSWLGKKYNYGNIVIETGKWVKVEGKLLLLKNTTVLPAVENPILVKNTLVTLANARLIQRPGGGSQSQQHPAITQFQPKPVTTEFKDVKKKPPVF